MDVDDYIDDAVRSPTQLTNAVPRPKSPRVPLRDSERRRSDSAPRAKLLAAERFQEVGTPEGTPNRSSSRTKRSNSRSTRDRNQNEQTLRDKARATVQRSSSKRHRPKPNRIRGCVNQGFSVGRTIGDCFAIGFDVYEQECSTKHQHRGEDRLFFEQQQQQHTAWESDSSESNSVTVDDSEPIFRQSNTMGRSLLDTTYSEYSASIVPPQEEEKKEADGSPRNVTELGMTPPRKHTEKSTERTATKKASPRRLLGAIHPEEPPSLRRPRKPEESPSSRRPRQPDPHLDSAPEDEELSYTDLSQLRLRMFQQDNSDGKYTRALEDLATQDNSLRCLEDELAETKRQLETTRHELRAARDQSTLQAHESTNANAQLFRERVEAEEKLRREILEKQQLSRHVSELQEEVNKLKLKSDNKDGSPAVMSMRTEIIDLRAQLAEARAARLSAEQSRRAMESRFRASERVMDELREQVLSLKQDLDAMKTQNEQLTKESKVGSTQLVQEVERYKSQLKDTEHENHAISQKAKRLEEELTETQVDAEKLRSQVARFMNEVEQTKKESERHQEISDEEARKLQAEVASMKAKLASTNSEIIEQASEHMKERQRLEDALNTMKRKVVELDDKIAESDALYSSQDLDTSRASMSRFLSRTLDAMNGKPAAAK